MADAIFDVSLVEARRIALAAQGFLPVDRKRNGPAPVRRDRRHLASVLDKVALFQIDSINVLVRSHYLPLFSRLGPYQSSLLEAAAYGRRSDRRLFEYWGHEASLISVELQPLLRWRMERACRFQGLWKGIAEYGRTKSGHAAAILREIEQRGPAGVSDFDTKTRPAQPWWGWNDTKVGLEWLFWTGKITTATRRGFERIYDLPERVLPTEVLATNTPNEAEAQRQLMLIAARAHGIATEKDLRDYFRLDTATAKERLAELVESEDLLPVSVEGWSQRAYLYPSAVASRRAGRPGSSLPRALLSPFDSLIWERARTERLFNFHYRIEIYTPAEKRRYGYYVLPFLLGDRLVARVDLKSDRQSGALAVKGAFAEPDTDLKEVGVALVEELGRMALWLGLTHIEMRPRGNLASVLSAHTRTEGGIEICGYREGQTGVSN